ncbi:MAG: hypothetical protein ACLUSL_08445 [Ruminococcus sp.]|jgi:hypothetical protein|uniref:hypothetical protein n=1 Tax=uncultured Ruminococcus sp. TaxID=165186 RepID=UPI00263750E9|nr:hypothetical protein [uncultured Ruminococcus sp.]
MRWIELNDGDLINLDAVASIVAGEKSNRVCYVAETETIATEIFATHEQVEHRMQQLKDLLLDK